MADFDGRIPVRRSCIASKKRSQGKGDGVMALTRRLLRRHAAAVSGGTVAAVEGSAGVSGDAGGMAVMRRTRKAGRIACGARPGYPDSKEERVQIGHASEPIYLRIAGNFIALVNQGRHFAECVCCSSFIFAHCLFGEGLKSIADTKKFRNLHGSGIFPLAAGEGFEPSHTESESAVLPLHKPAMRLSGTANRYYYTDNEENVNP